MGGTQGYIRLLTAIFRGKRVTCRYTGLHKATQGYMGYTGLQKATQGYIRLHRVT